MRLSQADTINPFPISPLADIINPFLISPPRHPLHPDQSPFPARQDMGASLQAQTKSIERLSDRTDSIDARLGKSNMRIGRML